ncbi:MAG: T9SS type A sorting domain-containing protein [Lewinella sp.]|nr:T9SS type A sorting domain-containing protein [Lewinella sp.]
MKLHPVTFIWKERPQDGAKLGLIAQEVQQVIREVVVDHELVRDERTGKISSVPAQNLGLLYSDLIPVLIKGVQEQQQIIEEKEKRITELEVKVEELKALEERLARLEQLLPKITETDVLLEGDGRPFIKQNAPNPFSETSSIDYFLPANTRNAAISIIDATGKLVKMIPLEHTGPGKINLTTHELPAGSYVYTLLIDGKPLDSKILIVN